MGIARMGPIDNHSLSARLRFVKVTSCKESWGLTSQTAAMP